MFRKIALLFACCTAGVSTVIAGVHQYKIEIDDNIANATVNICFDGQAPEYLAVDSENGNTDLVEFPHSKQGRIEIQGRYWKTKYLPDNACLDYVVDIKRHLAKRTKLSKNRKNIAYIETNTWLWLPEVSSEENDIALSFNLPKWASISAPWHQTDLARHDYLLGHQPQDWGYTLLIGDFERRLFEISPGHHLDIAHTRELPNNTEISKWLTETAKAVEHYLGDYPTPQTQIIVIEKDKLKHGPVPWGDFSRGNGFGIRFVIVPSYNIEAFYADWTATHEFTHQLLPKIHYDDIWLSEGLSSYLQYVLMGQSGRLEKEQAWYRIYKGLKRGEKGTQKVRKEPLYLTSNRRKSGGRSGRTMRIYWSGAAYFLKADLALRQHSEGKIGLNDILLKLNHCCIQGDKIWRGDELAAKLDELSNTKIFLESYKDISNSSKFPEFNSVFEQLGMTIPASGASKVRLKKNSHAWNIMQ